VTPIDQVFQLVKAGMVIYGAVLAGRFLRFAFYLLSTN
jgi:hypothetical protein